MVTVGGADHLEKVVHVTAVFLQEGVRPGNHRLRPQLAHAADGDHRAVPASELPKDPHAI
jgi:hypothetical protein